MNHQTAIDAFKQHMKERREKEEALAKRKQEKNVKLVEMEQAGEL